MLKLLPLDGEAIQHIVGFAEENNVVFVWSDGVNFMVQLETLQFKKLSETLYASSRYLPFESVYYTKDHCSGGGAETVVVMESAGPAAKKMILAPAAKPVMEVSNPAPATAERSKDPAPGSQEDEEISLDCISQLPDTILGEIILAPPHQGGRPHPSPRISVAPSMACRPSQSRLPWPPCH